MSVFGKLKSDFDTKFSVTDRWKPKEEPTQVGSESERALCSVQYASI